MGCCIQSFCDEAVELVKQWEFLQDAMNVLAVW